MGRSVRLAGGFDINFPSLVDAVHACSHEVGVYLETANEMDSLSLSGVPVFSYMVEMTAALTNWMLSAPVPFGFLLSVKTPASVVIW